MAKKDNAQKIEEPTVADQVAAADGMEMPNWDDEIDGFKKEGGSRVNPDVYFHKMEVDGRPNPICGIPLKRKQRKQRIDPKTGKPEPAQFYYILGLTKPAILFSGDKDREGKPIRVIARPGQFAWVDEKYCTASLASHLPVVDERTKAPMAVCEVLIRPTTKKPIGGGQSVWLAEVYAKSMRADPKTMPLLAPETSNVPPPQLEAAAGDRAVDDADIPF